MNENMKNWAALVGRVLLALIFIKAGWGKLNGFAGTAGYMAKNGLPMAEVLLVLTIIIELGGGLMILLGWKARWGALAIFLFIIPATLVFHAFWSAPAEQMQMQTTQFMKNLAIMGGMLMLVAFGPGKLAVERDKA